MSIGWLQDRLSMDIKNYKNEFYKFEVEKEVKENIWKWCDDGDELDYNSKNELISFMNTIISMDSNINSIELYNLNGDRTLITERRGAKLADTNDNLDLWKKRDEKLQTSVVFQRQGKEIAISHEVYDFFGNKPIALVVMKIRPYGLQDNLEGIKTTPDELILLYNDENQFIEADYDYSRRSTLVN